MCGCQWSIGLICASAPVRHVLQWIQAGRNPRFCSQLFRVCVHKRNCWSKQLFFFKILFKMSKVREISSVILQFPPQMATAAQVEARTLEGSPLRSPRGLSGPGGSQDAGRKPFEVSQGSQRPKYSGDLLLLSQRITRELTGSEAARPGTDGLYGV